jgi:hypothetical protein
MNSFLKYQLCLLEVTFHEFHWGRDLLISTGIAAVTTATQIHWNFIAPGQARGYWISVLAPYVIVLGAHIGWKRFIASWKVHGSQKTVIANKDLEIASKEAEIAAFKVRAIPRLKVPEIIIADVPTDNAKEQRIYVQVVLEPLTDAPVRDCRGFLQAIWRKTNTGWEKTQADEPLDLLWSNLNSPSRTIQAGTKPRLNLLWLGNLYQHMNLCLNQTPIYVSKLVQAEMALKFDIRITGEDCSPIDISVEVQRGAHWNKPAVNLLG